MTGESRLAIGSLGIFFIGGIIMLTLVDEEEGRRHALQVDAEATGQVPA
jgi:hypothetical protein